MKPEGYYFSSSEEGTMAIQMNDPGPGAAKIYWRPAGDIEDSKPIDTFVSMTALNGIVDQINKDRKTHEAQDLASKKGVRP